MCNYFWGNYLASQRSSTDLPLISCTIPEILTKQYYKNSGSEHKIIVECFTKEIGSITLVQIGSGSRLQTFPSNKVGYRILNCLLQIDDNITK